MKLPKSIDALYLADLSHRIRTLPPDEAACALLECGSVILLAGHPKIAYQIFIKLLYGELKISKESSLAPVLKSIFPSLCYLLKIDCPEIFEEKAMSIGDLEWYIEEKFNRANRVGFIDRWFQIPFPLGNWSENFIQEMTHPKVDITGNERFKAYKFIQDLHRVISRNIKQGKLPKLYRI
jgi:hypothetical protein